MVLQYWYNGTVIVEKSYCNHAFKIILNWQENCFLFWHLARKKRKVLLKIHTQHVRFVFAIETSTLKSFKSDSSVTLKVMPIFFGITLGSKSKLHKVIDGNLTKADLCKENKDHFLKIEGQFDQNLSTNKKISEIFLGPIIIVRLYF